MARVALSHFLLRRECPFLEDFGLTYATTRRHSPEKGAVGSNGTGGIIWPD
jgi:hypothetical protein